MKPSFLFFVSSIVSLLLGIGFRGATLEFSIGPTYYVIGYSLVGLLLALFFALLGGAYKMLWKWDLPLSRKWGLWHAAPTISGTIIILFLAQCYKDFHEFEYNHTLTAIIHLLIVLTLAAQLLFLYNVVSALKK